MSISWTKVTEIISQKWTPFYEHIHVSYDSKCLSVSFRSNKCIVDLFDDDGQCKNL